MLKRQPAGELIPIKEYYGLSLAAMIYRGSELGILTRGVANRFWKMRNQNPELKKENPAQFGHYLGQERPSRFEQLLAKALTLELVTYSKAAQMAPHQKPSSGSMVHGEGCGQLQNACCTGGTTVALGGLRVCLEQPLRCKSTLYEPWRPVFSVI